MYFININNNILGFNKNVGFVNQQITLFSYVEYAAQNNIKFIIRFEHYKNDVKILNNLILNKYNINDDKYNDIIEKNKEYSVTDDFDKNLSEDSIKNLKIYFKKDYLIVDKLKELNFISDDYVKSFL